MLDIHFNLDNKEYPFTLKTKEKKETECRAFALPAHTLSSNLVYMLCLSSLERSDNDLYQDKHTFKCQFFLINIYIIYTKCKILCYTTEQWGFYGYCRQRWWNFRNPWWQRKYCGRTRFFCIILFISSQKNSMLRRAFFNEINLHGSLRSNERRSSI